MLEYDMKIMEDELEMMDHQIFNNEVKIKI
jgi:hypothetical protein